MTVSVSLAELAQQLGLEAVGNTSLRVTGIANLADATSDQLAFLFNSAYRAHLTTTNAAAVVMRADDAQGYNGSALISDQPRMTWAQVAHWFDRTPIPDQQIHPTAVVDATCRLGQGVTIGANVVVESGCVIGDEVTIGPGCVLGEGVVIGDQTRLFANVTLYHEVIVGSQTLIHSGAVIGADGFGFEFDRSRGTLVKIPQVYGVRIGDRVEIGAGSTIDRGALNDTHIGDGVKLDNQVQIGHGTRIGANTAISGCTAIAGSTRVGSHCLIGGAVGIIDNIEIVDQVEITAMSLVSQSIETPGRYSSGTGLLPSRVWKRSIVGFKQLDKVLKRLRGLELKQGGRVADSGESKS
jgi:UDP-3-O-[3-hydroxymyristoyl] glucosamine N-acyltransferase